MVSKTLLLSLAPIVIVVLIHLAPIKRNDLSIYDTADWWSPNSSYAILKKMNSVRVPFFVSQIPAAKKIQIVDLGCGGGLVTENVAKLVPLAQVVGFDMSEPSIEVARNHGKGVPNLSYKISSIYNLPIANSSVDVVIISDVLEHLNDLPKALSEISRILKPRGIIVFDTIARSWWSFLSTYLVAQEVLGIVERGAHDWSMFIDPTELESLFKLHGFSTNISEWKGIVANMNLFGPLKTGKLADLISSFSVSDSDLRTSYMGYAVKN